MKNTKIVVFMLLLFVFIFQGFSLNNIEEKESINVDYINTLKSSKKETNYKRYYSFKEYSNSDINTVSNKKDIKNAIYNALNNKSDNYIIYCDYNCFNDFKDIFYNKELMLSISNYVSPFNKYKNILFSYLNNKIELTIKRKYNDEQIDKINEIIDKDINSDYLNTLSDKEKIKILHNYLINKVKYDKKHEKDKSSDAHSAYGAFVNNKAVCQGYTEAMSILLDRFNIPNILISSKDHIWNLVYVENEWKHIDVTWDDPITINGKNKLIYDYYLINNNKLSKLDNSSNHKYFKDYYLEISK